MDHFSHHRDSHDLRGCAQEIFTGSANEFPRHLDVAHNVDLSLFEHVGLLNGQQVQFFETFDGRGLIRTSQTSSSSQNGCVDTAPGYTFTFVNL
jgi:hypothetical protein